MAGRDLERLTGRLCDLSRRANAADTGGLIWPAALDPQAWCMSPELISLHGTAAYNALDERARQCLGFWEAVNFFSLNINGERALIAGLSDYRRRASGGVSDYLGHFIDEEADHMAMFGEFCARYAGKAYGEKRLKSLEQGLPEEEELLLFAKAVLFEELVDAFNRRMARDPRLDPLVRQINRIHHGDEARHLAFGRAFLAKLYRERAAVWPETRLAAVRRRLVAFLDETWSLLFNPSAYADAGLPEPYGLRRLALSDPAVRARRAEMLSGCNRILASLGCTEETGGES